MDYCHKLLLIDGSMQFCVFESPAFKSYGMTLLVQNCSYSISRCIAGYLERFAKIRDDENRPMAEIVLKLCKSFLLLESPLKRYSLLR